MALPLRLPEKDTHISDDIKQIETRFPARAQTADSNNTKLSRAVRLYSVWSCIFTMKVFIPFLGPCLTVNVS